MRIFSRLGWIMVILAAGILAVVGHSIWLSAPVASVPLPDGTLLHIEAVTCGTQHVVGPDTSLRLQLLKQAPQVLGKWFIPIGMKLLPTEGQSRLETGNDSVVLWVSWYSPTNALYLNVREIIPVLRDDHGCGFHPSAICTYDFSGFGIRNNFNRAAFIFESVPASQKLFDAEFGHLHSFRWRVNGRDDYRPRVPIRNPRLRIPTVWRAGTLPTTQSVQEIKVVMDSLEKRQEFNGNGMDYWRLAARGRVEPLLNSPAEWEQPQWAFEDSTGNRGPEFCEYESAIKCTATIYPAPQTDLPDIKRVHLPLVTPPPLTNGVVWQTNMNCGDASFRVLGLWGPGTYLFRNGSLMETHLPQAQEGWHGSTKYGPNGRPIPSYIHSSSNHVLFLQNVKLGERQRLQLRVRDDQGRLCYTGTYSTDLPAPYASVVRLAMPEAPGLRTASLVKPLVGEVGSASFTFHLPPDVQKVALEFSVINPRRAEFFVKPPFSKGKM